MILSEGFSGVQIGWRESNIRRSSGGEEEERREGRWSVWKEGVG